jgi:thiamine biosynthesis lipoprotein
MTHARTTLGALIALFVSFMLPGSVSAAELERHEYTKLAMGVEALIVLYAPNEDVAARAATAAFARIDEIDATLSHWQEDSELNDMCRSAGRPFQASPDLSEVIHRASLAFDLTGGAFDITVRPLSDLWKRTGAEGRLPTAAELAAVRQHVGRDKILQRGREIELQVGTTIDVGGIGKGYACDQALATLTTAGFPKALVEIGGDVALGDPPPGRTGWEILVGGNTSRGPRLLTLANRGVASSGDREQHIEIDGTRYSHVIDPRTGHGTTHGLGFSVVARNATWADAFASAACVLGPTEARKKLLAMHDVDHVIVEDARYTPLFDGLTLDNWKTSGGRYDGDARWSAEDGCLVGRSGDNNAGGLIYTEAPWTHFALDLDVMIARPFDSGVFLRMLPREEGDLKGVQVTLDDVDGGYIGAIYADGFLSKNSKGLLHWNRGQWNHVEVRCTGFDFRLQVFLNGHLVMDYQLPEGTAGYAQDGLIGLQVHPGKGSSQGEVRFRHIEIRPLPAFGEELGEDFEPIFNGTDLTGWEPVGSTEGYFVENRELCVPAEGGGYVRTTEDFEDFRLRLDFKPARMANSGVYLRSARTDENPSFSGCEVQILDDFNWEAVTESTLVPYQFTGGLYGSVPPAANVLRPIGEWNTYEILYRGSRLAVALNSKTLYDVDTHALEGDNPFAERVPEGFLGFQRYGAPDTQGEVAVRFRNIQVQRLESSESLGAPGDESDDG